MSFRIFFYFFVFLVLLRDGQIKSQLSICIYFAAWSENIPMLILSVRIWHRINTSFCLLFF